MITLELFSINTFDSKNFRTEVCKHSKLFRMDFGFKISAKTFHLSLFLSNNFLVLKFF